VPFLWLRSVREQEDRTQHHCRSEELLAGNAGKHDGDRQCPRERRLVAPSESEEQQEDGGSTEQRLAEAEYPELLAEDSHDRAVKGVLAGRVEDHETFEEVIAVRPVSREQVAKSLVAQAEGAPQIKAQERHDAERAADCGLDPYTAACLNGHSAFEPPGVAQFPNRRATIDILSTGFEDRGGAHRHLAAKARIDSPTRSRFQPE
jgi:hypothetical protein